MAEKYSSDLLRVVVAQIAQTIGYSNTQSAPVELLEDILHKFIQELARNLHSQAEHANRIEPNLKDVFMSLKILGIDVYEILDYIGNVEPVAFYLEVPKYPIKRDPSMNFLKPGSSETLTRPVHIFEYLPPILHAESYRQDHEVVSQSPLGDMQNQNQKSTSQFQEAVSDFIPSWRTQNESMTHLLNTSSRDNMDNEIQVVREISSVVMTTGGFISPAIEGKLPEAFVPDIIDKFKGLDAPPDTSPPHIHETIKTYSNKDVSADVPINTKVMFELTPYDRSEHVSHVIESTPNENTFLNNDQSIDLANAQSSFLTIKPTKLEKKYKKKHSIGQRKYQTVDDNIMNKAQDKAHRKALKLYQKISKTQNPTVSFKKSMKNVNRGIFSGLPEKPNERLQLEKIIKKQTKQRQKQMKSQKHQQHQEGQLLPPIITNCETSVLPVENDVDISKGPLTVLDKADKQIMPVMATSNMDLVDERKLSSEPDRNKLNIFKKISKQKSTKVLLPNTIHNTGSNLLDNTNSSGSSLINLPSGTTITPAPLFNATNNVQISSSNMSPGIKMPIFSEPDRVFEISEKPKKRGRKPGGKNQVKPPPFSAHITSPVTQINSPNKMNITKLPSPSPHLSIDCTNSEPLNLTNVDQFKAAQTQNLLSNDDCNEATTFNDILKLPKVKEKREKKKAKSKMNPSLSIVDQFSENKHLSQLNFPMDEHTVSIEKSLKSSTTMSKGSFSLAPSVVADAFLRGGLGAQSETNIHNSNMIYAINERNILPMLPMLHFPPRPGLIPSGIFPPTNLTSFSPQVCSTIPNNIIPNPFTFPTGNRSTMNGIRSSLTENGDNLSSRPLQTSLPVSELHSERGYCNVAPLVPESMKLTTAQGISDGNKMECTDSITKDMSISNTLKCSVSSYEILNKPKSPAIKTLPSTATGNLGDPIEVSDDSNDTDLNVTNKNKEPISALPPHTFVFKSSKCQTFANPRTEKSASVQPHSGFTSQLYSPDSKQLKKLTNPTSASLKTNHHPDTNILSSPFNINYMGNDKFSLAGGADLIPLSRIDSGQAYSSQTVPSTSLTAGSTSGALPNSPSNSGSNFIASVKYDDITITPTSSIQLHDLKMNKLHKKLKKTKEGKVKKKKDKKEKTKNRDKKDEKKILNNEKTKKSPDKKLKKKREKLADELHKLSGSSEYNKPEAHSSSLFLDSMPVGGVDAFQTVHQTTTFTDHLPPSKLDVSTNQVPKLTLKLGEKLAYTPKELDEEGDRNAGNINSIELTPPSQLKREHSPELARFSPLVTGPPKPKPSEAQPINIIDTSPPSTYVSTASTTPQSVLIPTAASNHGASSSTWIPATGVPETASPVASSSTLSASSVLLPQQLMKPSKPIQNIPSVSQNQTKESQVMPSESEEMSRPSSYVDAEGYRIWICPACGKVDDGSAMIGCDGCDAWYHWVCVGITIAPNDNDDWFCRVCVAKRKLNGLDKKKKRNKKK